MHKDRNEFLEKYFWQYYKYIKVSNPWVGGHMYLVFPKVQLLIFKFF